MIRNRNLIRLLIGGALFLGASGALFLHDLRPVAADATNPTPKELYGEKCSGCHNLPDPAGEAMTVAQWRRTVNRMLYQHGASSSITGPQSETIIAYLTTFATQDNAAGGGRRGGLGRRNPDSSDVFATDPIYTKVYRFRTKEAVAPFRAISAKWDVYDSSVGPLLAITPAPNGGSAALLVAPTPGLHGDMSEEASFRPALPTEAPTVTVPVSFGLTFDTTDANNTYLARYDDAKKVMELVRIQNGQETVLQSVPVAAGLAASPDGWHKFKVNIVEGRAKVWLDFDKEIDLLLPDTPGNGGGGIWTNTKACVRSFTLDIYPTNVPNVAI